MYEIPREPWQDDLKMSPEVKAQRDSTELRRVLRRIR